MKMRMRVLFLSWVSASFAVSCAGYDASSPFLYLFMSKNPVKAVQSGTISMAASSTVSVSLTAVDPSKSFSMCYISTNNSAADQMCATDLASSGTLTVTTGATGANLFVTWYVVEFNSGVTVQRGTNAFAIGAASASPTLATAVDLSKSFPIVQTWTTDANTNLDEERTVRGTLPTTTSLQLVRNQSAVSVTSCWQVVQMTDSWVQSGTVTIAAGQTSADVPLTSVTTSKTFVTTSVAADANSNGNDEEFYVRATLSDSTTAHFERYSSLNTVTISYYVVSLSDRSFVQSGVTGSGVGSFTNTDTDFTATLPISIDRSKTIPFVSAKVSNTGGGGPSTDQDSGSLAPTFPNSTSIQLTRGSSQPRNVSGSYFAVQFQDSSFQ